MTVGLYLEEFDGSSGRDSWESHGENVGKSGDNGGRSNPNVLL
jgi:hypothetical protein